MVRTARIAVATLALVMAALLGSACSSEQSLPGANGEFTQPPYTTGVEIGKSYSYQLSTHCGIRWARIDGRVWETTPLDDGNANPPDGWSNPYQSGKVVLESGESARFEGGGHELRFERSDGEPPGCS